jgi:hypothetical protein
MTARHEIVAASVRHIRPMSKRLRTAACITLQRFGQDPRRGLHRAFISSNYCRTALIDGRPVAMWGVCGALMSNVASVWLVIAEDIVNLPLAIVREARTELSRVMGNYHELVTTVLPDDEAAVRFALYLGFQGFEDDDDAPRKVRYEEIMSDPKHRIPVGDSYVIGLGYRAEAY